MKHFDIFRPKNDSNGNNLAVAHKVCNYISTEGKIVFQCEAVPLNPDEWYRNFKVAWWGDDEIIIIGNVFDLIQRNPYFSVKCKEEVK